MSDDLARSVRFGTDGYPGLAQVGVQGSEGSHIVGVIHPGDLAACAATATTRHRSSCMKDLLAARSQQGLVGPRVCVAIAALTSRRTPCDGYHTRRMPTRAITSSPTLSSAQKSEDTTLTGWTTALSAGDILRFNVDSVAIIARVTLALALTRT
jgi:hypothetical protein